MTRTRIVSVAVGLAAMLGVTVSAIPNVWATADAGLESFRADYVRPAKIPFPTENPYSEEKYELGRQLFFEPRISGSGVISCATCHNPGLGWEDGLPTGLGHMGTQLGRHTPTVLNLAWGDSFFWDGRASSLEEQALGPIQAAVEMNMTHEDVVARLGSIDGYVSAFKAAFPQDEVNIENVGKAIATFERTIVSNEAPFDRWVNGDDAAMSDAAKRGFALFNTKANCASCHTGWRFTDDGFHDIGVSSADKGRGEILPIAVLQHAFKTPTLRNIDQRAPYMHDGSEATLLDVVEFYNDGFERRESLSTMMEPLGLNDGEKTDLVAFLETLTSEDDAIAVPNLPK